MSANRSNRSLSRLFGLVKYLIFVLVLLIGGLIVYVTSRYLDPSDSGGYLSGRTEESLSLIRYSVLLHATFSFLTLILASVLIFFRIEENYHSTHRFIGKITVFLTLLFLVPTGFILSYHAMGGIPGRILFSLLTLLTLIFIVLGFLAASRKRITEHRQWMLRFYIVLTSAIWLRLNLFICFQIKWVISENDYFWCSVLSWIPQLLLLEFFLWFYRRNSI